MAVRDWFCAYREITLAPPLPLDTTSQFAHNVYGRMQHQQEYIANGSETLAITGLSVHPPKLYKKNRRHDVSKTGTVSVLS
jgi:hypothetical protein